MRPLMLALALVALVAGCGSAADEGAQPRPDVTTFEQGDFDDIPLVSTSEPLTPPNEEAGTVSRSYVVRNTAPEQVLEFYERQLAEFTVVARPEAIGTNTFRGSWQLDEGRVLIVSATLTPTPDGVEEFENVETVTQYSLSLSPADG